MTKQPTYNVLISGAGVAGLSLAYWLNRAGHTVTIVERSPALRTGGYAVDVRGTAVEVLKKMGIYADVRAHDTNMKTVTFVGADATHRATIDADVFGGRVEGDLEVPRGDVLNVLYGRIKDEVTLQFSDSVASLKQSPDSIQVGFESGKRADFDLVVGADGVHSRVRQLILGDESAYLKPLGARIAIATIPNFLQLDHAEMLYAEPGRSVFVYSSDAATAKALFLFQDDSHTSVRNIAEQKALLKAKLGSITAWEVPEILQHAIDSDDFYLDTVTTIQLPAYSKGRAVLLGDAGYCASPASGQGTSLALIGAYLLAGEVTTSANIEAGLSAYEARMRPFAEQNQKLAPMALQGMIMKSKAFIVVRDLMLRFPALFNAMNKPVLNRIQKAAFMRDLPEYP